LKTLALTQISYALDILSSSNYTLCLNSHDMRLNGEIRMKLNLLAIERDGIVRLAAEGEITSQKFKGDKYNPLTEVMGAAWSSSRVLLSLEAVPYIDSFAIGWLLSCNREFKNNGGRLIIHSIRPNVSQILDLLKIASVLTFAESEQAARKALSEGAQ
jgi:anti-anti-sigma factor